ncbi:MAG: site-specific integrase [Thermomicrobiales bacterium]
MAIQIRTGADGKPRYRVQVAWHDPETGKRHNIGIGTFALKKVAEAKERDALREIERGEFIPPKVKAERDRLEAARRELTVKEALDSWLTGLKIANSVSANTWLDYSRCSRLHICPVLGEIPVATLTRADVRSFVRSLQEGGKAGAQVQNRSVLCLRRALDELVEDGVIAANPAARIKLPSPKTKQQLPEWTKDDLRRFLDKADKDLIGAGWHLLAVEGLRRGEMLGARWRDVRWGEDEATAVLEIVQTVAPSMEKGGAPVIQGRTKTSAGTRNVQLTAATVAALKRHRDRQAFARQKAGEAWQDHDLICCNEVGMPFRPDSVIVRLRNLATAAKVPEMTVHQLRHNAISMMVRGGAPLALVAAKVGHADVAITFRTYSHLAPADQQAANDILDALLTGTD